jgi:hypothetical protein
MQCYLKLYALEFFHLLIQSHPTFLVLHFKYLYLQKTTMKLTLASRAKCDSWDICWKSALKLVFSNLTSGSDAQYCYCRSFEMQYDPAEALLNSWSTDFVTFSTLIHWLKVAGLVRHACFVRESVDPNFQYKADCDPCSCSMLLLVLFYDVWVLYSCASPFPEQCIILIITLVSYWFGWSVIEHTTRELCLLSTVVSDDTV